MKAVGRTVLPATCLLVYCLLLAACGRLMYWPQKSAPGKDLCETTATRRCSDTFTKSYSGNILHLRLISPTLPSQTVFIYFHGNARNVERRQEDFLWVADSGMHYLIWDYSGFGHSSGSPGPRTLALDTRRIIDHVDSVFPNHKKVYFATSIGGATLLGALRGSDVKGRTDRLFVLDCTFGSFRRIGVDRMVRSAVGAPLFFLPYLVLSDRYAPNYNLENLAGGRYLFTHCLDDTSIPIHFGKDLYDRIEAAQKEFWTLEDCGHSKGFDGAHPGNRSRLLDFLKEKGVFVTDSAARFSPSRRY